MNAATPLRARVSDEEFESVLPILLGEVANSTTVVYDASSYAQPGYAVEALLAGSATLEAVTNHFGRFYGRDRLHWALVIALVEAHQHHAEPVKSFGNSIVYEYGRKLFGGEAQAWSVYRKEGWTIWEPEEEGERARGRCKTPREYLQKERDKDGKWWYRMQLGASRKVLTRLRVVVPGGDPRCWDPRLWHRHKSATAAAAAAAAYTPGPMCTTFLASGPFSSGSSGSGPTGSGAHADETTRCTRQQLDDTPGGQPPPKRMATLHPLLQAPRKMLTQQPMPCPFPPVALQQAPMVVQQPQGPQQPHAVPQSQLRHDSLPLLLPFTPGVMARHVHVIPQALANLAQARAPPPQPSPAIQSSPMPQQPLPQPFPQSQRPGLGLQPTPRRPPSAQHQQTQMVQPPVTQAAARMAQQLEVREAQDSELEGHLARGKEELAAAAEKGAAEAQPPLVQQPSAPLAALTTQTSQVLDSTVTQPTPVPVMKAKNTQGLHFLRLLPHSMVPRANAAGGCGSSEAVSPLASAAKAVPKVAVPPASAEDTAASDATSGSSQATAPVAAVPLVSAAPGPPVMPLVRAYRQLSAPLVRPELAARGG